MAKTKSTSEVEIGTAIEPPVSATYGDAIRVLPTALIYHFTLPHAFPFLPEVTESLGMRVELRDTGKSGIDQFFDYLKGDLQYEHIADDNQRRMNDWLTTFILLNSAWPYIPLLGIYRGFKIGQDAATRVSKDEGIQTASGVISLMLTAPFNVFMGIYDAANFLSAKIREDELDKAMLSVSDRLPLVLGAGIDEADKSQPKDPVADTVAKTLANFMLAPWMPLMGTYKGISMVSDATHRNRETQIITTMLAIPIIGTVALPFLMAAQSNQFAQKLIDGSGISNWLSGVFNSGSKTVAAITK